MSFVGANPKFTTETFRPQSADPSNPTEGMVFRSNGTPRAVGLWEYRSGAWQPLSTDGSMVLLSTQTASSSATIDFTSINTSLYSSFIVMGFNVVPATNGVNLLLRFSNASSFAATNYGWQNWRWTTTGSGVSGQSPTSATGVSLNSTADTLANTGTNAGIDFTVTCYNLGNTSYTKKLNYQSFYFGSALLAIIGSGIYQNTAAVDGIRFIMDSGNIATGTFKLYGVK